MGLLCWSDKDVESYSATVEADGTTVAATSTTVLVAPYTVDDGRSNSFCSAALLDASEWTKVTRKTKTTRRPGRPPSMQGSTEFPGGITCEGLKTSQG